MRQYRFITVQGATRFPSEIHFYFLLRRITNVLGELRFMSETGVPTLINVI